MSERGMLVHVDLNGEPVLAGRLFMRVLRNRESASFTYDASWLRHPRRFALDPLQLPLTAGTFNTAGGEKLFPGVSDSAPDRWGRTLMARQARFEDQKRTLYESDYMLMVHDPVRQGALRFQDAEGGPFLAHAGPAIPPLVRLGELLEAADGVQKDPSDRDALRLLLAPGSSLGGARPKASVVDGRAQLSIAKFPSVNDDWPVTSWEKVASDLAMASLIVTAETTLRNAGNRAVLLTRRFDREGPVRVPFLSSMALIGARDGGSDASYLEIADAIRQHGDKVDPDLRELWRRMVFNVLTSNTDDHLRNHGFLRGPQGWRLAPAYDLNPVPIDVRPRIHALKLDETSADSSLDTVLSVAAYFGISAPDAQTIAGDVGRAVLGWRKAARRRGLKAADLDRMASAFEHEDLAKARKLG